VPGIVVKLAYPGYAQIFRNFIFFFDRFFEIFNKLIPNLSMFLKIIKMTKLS